MPIQVDGVLVHAISGTELCRVRTEPPQLCVFPTQAQSPKREEEVPAGKVRSLGQHGDLARHIRKQSRRYGRFGLTFKIHRCL